MEGIGTPAEIKEVYRDLAKVWHPDRFGSDERLRRKAEDKLKQINDAYRVLRTNGGMVGGYSAAAPVGSASPQRGAGRVPQKQRPRVRQVWVSPALFYGLVGLLVISLGAYAFFQSGLATTMPPHISIDQPTQSVSTPLRSSQTSGAPARRTVTSPTPSDQAKAAPFQVRVLSEADTAQIDAACSRERHAKDLTAYSACVRAELGHL